MRRGGGYLSRYRGGGRGAQEGQPGRSRDRFGSTWNLGDSRFELDAHAETTRLAQETSGFDETRLVAGRGVGRCGWHDGRRRLVHGVSVPLPFAACKFRLTPMARGCIRLDL